MEVLRLEDEFGNGIFNSVSGIMYNYEFCTTLNDNPREHPSIWDEKFRRSNGNTLYLDHLKNWDDYFCGFESFNQLKIWFPCQAGRAAMAEKGCVLKRFDFPAPTVLCGDYQVVFNMKLVDSSVYDCLNIVTGKII